MTSSCNLAVALLSALALATLGVQAQIYNPPAAILDSSPTESSSSSSSSHVENLEELAVAAAAAAPAREEFITQTVYGFLDFTTTIANTVMVFSPQSAPPEGAREPKSSASSAAIETKPSEPEKKKAAEIKPSRTQHKHAETKKKEAKIVVNSVIEQNVVQQADDAKIENAKSTQRIEVVSTKSPTLSTTVEVKRQGDDVPGVKNNLAEPEYDFLSKQPTEVVDETYKVINLRPSAKNGAGGNPQKPRPSAPRPNKENPTGLVTKLGGTIVKDGLTTVHETSVIGTYINGKYAQVLQSSSRVLTAPNSVENGGAKIKPSGAQRILKTIGPQQHKIKKQQQQQEVQQLEATQQQVLSDEPQEQGFRRRPSNNNNGAARPNKYRNQNKVIVESEGESGEIATTQQPQNRPGGKNRANRPGYKNRPQQSVTTTTPESTAAGTRRRTGFRPSASNTNTNTQKSFKKTDSPLTLSNPSIKSKLPRTQGRWSYKTTPKPRVAIRKQPGEDEAKLPQLQPQNVPVTNNLEQGGLNAPGPQSNPQYSANPDEQQQQQQLQRKIQDGEYDGELDESESEDVVNVRAQDQQLANGAIPIESTQRLLPMETLNVEISTPADFNDIYFEIATIKSPFEFQAGASLRTRFVTVTSTIKKSFATAEPTPTISPTEPLTENILANTGAAYESSLPLDSSVATLPAITLEPSQATPPLETMVETFSTTQTLLKTHLLPVVAADGNSTTRITLVQTYNIARIVTATKTLPPAEIYQFVPSKTLNEFNTKLDEAGSELHLELDFGDDERDDDDIPKRIVAPSNDGDSDLDIFKSVSPTSRIKTELSSTITTEPPMTPEQAQQLALLKLLGQSQPQVITTSRPVVKLETVYESHVIPLINKGNTFFSTISRPIATVPRTTYEYGTSTIAPLLSPQVPQVPQVPLFPPVQPQFTVTSAPIVQQTIATVSDSKVLKLHFGAKTQYTTLYSTRLVPTETTTYVTSTIALQPQPAIPAAYPGYYPPPAVGYPGYPFVG